MRESPRLRILRLPQLLQLLLTIHPLRSLYLKLKCSRLIKMTSLSQMHLHIMQHLRISRIHRIRVRETDHSRTGIMVTEIIP